MAGRIRWDAASTAKFQNNESGPRARRQREGGEEGVMVTKEVDRGWKLESGRAPRTRGREEYSRKGCDFRQEVSYSIGSSSQSSRTPFRRLRGLSKISSSSSSSRPRPPLHRPGLRHPCRIRYTYQYPRQRGNFPSSATPLRTSSPPSGAAQLARSPPVSGAVRVRERSQAPRSSRRSSRTSGASGIGCAGSGMIVRYDDKACDSETRKHNEPL